MHLITGFVMTRLGNWATVSLISGFFNMFQLYKLDFFWRKKKTKNIFSHDDNYNYNIFTYTHTNSECVCVCVCDR